MLIHHYKYFLTFLSFILSINYSFAGFKEYTLTIDTKELIIGGKKIQVITINDLFPGPVLRFTEGDVARIHVVNKLKEETSIHWHGILVPPNMDGVPFVSFPPIKPGTSFTYEFPIRQSGTYWYHSHSHLQEQSGLYGAIVIEPKEKKIKYDREYVILISDWSEESPKEILKTLKSGNDWYSIEKGTATSIIGAIKASMFGDYIKSELTRMPPMDISDVAYDYFLVNGKPEINVDAYPGETILFRIINGSSMSYFYLEFAGGNMTVVSADGLDVEPFEIKRMLIATAETYDVLVQIPSPNSYELRATAYDSSGFASVWIGSGQKFYAPNVPKPNLYHFMGEFNLDKIFALTPEATVGMSDYKIAQGTFDKPFKSYKMYNHRPEHNEHDKEHENNHNQRENYNQDRYGKKYKNSFGLLASDIATFSPLVMDGLDPERPDTPYEKLRSLKPTSFPPEKPIQEIRLTLDGDMERYVWLLNNKPISPDTVIKIKGGHIVRLILINRTMMHHPMHLHGHFFRVLNEARQYSPLKHTVSVAPLSTTVIEFDANEPGDWFFHCHFLYHMKSGMETVIHYDGFQIDAQLEKIRPKIFKDQLYFFGNLDILTNSTNGKVIITNTKNSLSLEWEAGWEKVDNKEAELILQYKRHINSYFSLLGGTYASIVEKETDRMRLFAGINYILPLSIELKTWIDNEYDLRIVFSKQFKLLPRVYLGLEGKYDTHNEWEGYGKLSYTVNKAISLIGLWHSKYGIGAGIEYRF